MNTLPSYPEPTDLRPTNYEIPVFIIDDNSQVLKVLSRILLPKFPKQNCFNEPLAAEKAILGFSKPAIILSDYNLEVPTNGIDLANSTDQHRRQNNQLMIILSGQCEDNQDLLDLMVKNGTLSAYYGKPWENNREIVELVVKTAHRLIQSSTYPLIL